MQPLRFVTQGPIAYVEGACLTRFMIKKAIVDCELTNILRYDTSTLC